MTVSSQDPISVSVANGVTVEFPYNFRILAAGDLYVEVDGAQQTLGVDYTVSGVGANSGGIVTFVSPPADGSTVVRQRQMQYKRDDDFQTGGDLRAVEVNKNYDSAVMMIQQLAEAVGRALVLPPGLSGVGTLPAPESLKGLRWNSSETGIENYEITGFSAPGGSDLVGFIQAGIGAITRTTQEKARERYTALDIIPGGLHAAIANGTSITNVATYVNQACANADEIILPPGRYYLTDAFTLPSGKRLRGSGKHKTILYVPSTFNMAAAGVIVLQGNTDPGGAVEDLTIRFEQPDTGVRANLHQYPPAIRADSSPRFAIRRVRIELAWDGIDMKGNNGGAVIDDLEICAFNIDIDIDGSLDSVKLSRLHHWPFGLVIPSRPLLYSLYENIAHIGINCGRCDDFHLSDSIFFSLRSAAVFYQSASGATFGNIVNCDFDDRGGLNVSAAGLSVSACYFSIGKTDAVVANISGGSVAFNGCAMSISALPLGGKAVVVTGANTQVLWCGGMYGAGAIDCTAISGDTNCRLNVTGSLFDRTTNVAYGQPTVNYSNARGMFIGNTTGAKGAGAGTFVNVGGDLDVHIGPNIRSGWAYTLPAGALGLVRVSPGPTVLSQGSGTYATLPGGTVGINHGAPMRPKQVLFTPMGTGTAYHIQLEGINDTQFSIKLYDMAGVALGSTNFDMQWVAFG